MTADAVRLPVRFAHRDHSRKTLMKLRLTLTLLLLLLPVPSFAQAIVATPTYKLAIDVPACVGCPAMDVATATSYTYKVYLDGATTGTPLTGLVCAGTTTITCTELIPAFTAGAHTITVTATNAFKESGQSKALTFTMITSAPGAPMIRFISGP